MTAAWTAGSLYLDLLILKSVDDIFINDILQKQVTGPWNRMLSINFSFRFW